MDVSSSSSIIVIDSSRSIEEDDGSDLNSLIEYTSEDCRSSSNYESSADKSDASDASEVIISKKRKLFRNKIASLTPSPVTSSPNKRPPRPDVRRRLFSPQRGTLKKIFIFFVIDYVFS
jgi:hypothetical protein